VPVHRGLRRSGGAGGVEPEGGRVLRRRVRGGERLTQRQFGERLPRQDPGELRRLGGGLLGEGEEFRTGREEPRVRVAEQFGQAVGVQHGGHRHRDRADPHRGEEDRDELGRVRHEHHQPLLGLEPEVPQPGGGAGDAVVQLGVGRLAARSGEREAVAVAVVEAPVEQVCAGVEQAVVEHRGHGRTFAREARRTVDRGSGEVHVL
jgi:hypothetical protein